MEHLSPPLQRFPEIPPLCAVHLNLKMGRMENAAEHLIFSSFNRNRITALAPFPDFSLQREYKLKIRLFKALLQRMFHVLVMFPTVLQGSGSQPLTEDRRP